MMTTSWFEQRVAGFVGMSTMVALGVCVVGCGAPDATEVEHVAVDESALCQDHDPNPALFAKNAHPYGVSMEVWGERWWRWIYSIPAATNPLLNPTVDSNQNQSGPVFFLAPGNRTNTIPRHRAIAVAMSTVDNDYPCPDPNFEPAPGQSLFDFLISGVEPIQNAVTEVDATLDGVPLVDLLSYRAASDDLTYVVGDPSLQANFDACITGSQQPMVMDAYMFIIKPLEPGQHILTTRVVNQQAEVFAHTHILDVQ